MLKRILFLFLFLFPVFSVTAQLNLFLSDLQKGFRAIDKSNYDKGIEIFNGILSGDSTGVGAHYGLAKIYFAKDYTGFSAEKAYSHIVIAQRNFANADKKTLSTLNKLNIDQNSIENLKGKIDDELFSKAAADNSTEALNTFIRKYPDNSNIPAAKELLEQLSFFNANASNSDTKLDEFIKNNPGSKDLSRAIRTRNMLAFQKAKAANSSAALNDFIRNHPDAEEINEAKMALASLEFIEAKKANTIAAYDTFMTRYPDAAEYADAMMQRNQLAYIQVLEEQKNRDSKELKQKDADIEKAGTQLTFVAIGLVIVLLVAGLLYRSYSQKKKSNKEITQQKEIIEQKNKEIVDSINYARRIQESLLPSLADIRKSLPESFVYYRPRDIVSGDFYWHAQNGDKILIAAADCTGHGVPGSLVSMIGFNFLNQLVGENDITDPGEILNQLHTKITTTLNKEAGDGVRDVRDGMDIALVSINRASGEIRFAGAVRPLYFFDENGMNVIKSGLYSIGGIKSLTEDPFTSHLVKPKGKAMFYLFSDGYADQFGGTNGKKFKMKKLQDLLQSIAAKSVEEQRKEVEKVFLDWMGPHEQVDDVCMIGVRV
jgi:serine phosphatase RsbU (regulator of sigma subunit)